MLPLVWAALLWAPRAASAFRLRLAVSAGSLLAMSRLAGPLLNHAMRQISSATLRRLCCRTWPVRSLKRLE
eukprot:4508366-Pyramimonas_sp.AAC.1